MFYKFNPLLGRIARSSMLDAYVPQGFGVKLAETSNVIFESNKVKTVKVSSEASTLSSILPGPDAIADPKGHVPTAQGYAKIIKTQAEWAVPGASEKLVWQKRVADTPLYFFTMALSAAGCVVVALTVFKMSFPAKKE